MTQQNNQEVPLQWIFKEDAKVTITAEQYNTITAPLRAFEDAIAKANLLRDSFINEKQLIPTFNSDYVEVKNSDGTPMYAKHPNGTTALDEKGEPVVMKKLRDDFFTPKIKTKSLILDKDGESLVEAEKELN